MGIKPIILRRPVSGAASAAIKLTQDVPVRRVAAVIGVDPGNTGAVVALDADGNVLLAELTPTVVLKKKKGSRTKTSTVMDLSAIIRLLRPVVGPSTVVAIEEVHAMPKQGVVSMFNFGVNFGQWQGITAGLYAKMVLIRPNDWMKRMFVGVPPADNTKDRAAIACKRLFPTIDLSLKKYYPKADAVLLAEHVRRDLKNG